MREHFETIRTGDRGKCYTGCLRHANSQRGWRRYRHYHGCPDRCALLHHLNGHAAGGKYHAFARSNGRTRHCTRKLVERVVTADILAQGRDTACEVPKGRRADRASRC